MTEIHVPPPASENDNIASGPPSFWVMLISMLLLISVLVLSSATLLHYAANGKERATKDSIFNITKLKEMGKEFSTKTQTAKEQSKTENEPLETTIAEPSDSAVKKFFSGSGTVRWPKLKLTGFGTPANSTAGFAIINGKHLVAGSTINGATLLEILEHGVLVEYKGETKMLIVEVVH